MAPAQCFSKKWRRHSAPRQPHQTDDGYGAFDLPLNWQATTTIIKEDNEVDSHFINEGEIFSLDDLWHVALIGSSNGAISALVRKHRPDDGGIYPAHESSSV